MDVDNCFKISSQVLSEVLKCCFLSIVALHFVHTVSMQNDCRPRLVCSDLLKKWAFVYLCPWLLCSFSPLFTVEVIFSSLEEQHGLITIIISLLCWLTKYCTTDFCTLCGENKRSLYPGVFSFKISSNDIRLNLFSLCMLPVSFILQQFIKKLKSFSSFTALNLSCFIDTFYTKKTMCQRSVNL